MSGEKPEAEALKRHAGSQPVAVDLKKSTFLGARVVVVRADDPEPQPWRSGDPVPITGTAGFGATTVTITVNIPYEASRSNYSLYVGQNNPTPSTSTPAVAFSSGQPAGNVLGTTVNYTNNQALTIELTYVRPGSTPKLANTIPAGSVSSGTISSFVLA